MNLPVYVWPSAILRKPAEDFTPEEMTKPDFLELVAWLEETMRIANGVGLAAPQIGVPKRLLVLNPDYVGAGETVLVNARIVGLNAGDPPEHPGPVPMREGCLSFPGVILPIPRYRGIEVSALSIDGSPLRFAASGNMAHVLQHEIDHLDGKTLHTHCAPVRRDMLTRKFRKLRGKILYREAT